MAAGSCVHEMWEVGGKPAPNQLAEFPSCLREYDSIQANIIDDVDMEARAEMVHVYVNKQAPAYVSTCVSTHTHTHTRPRRCEGSMPGTLIFDPHSYSPCSVCRPLPIP